MLIWINGGHGVGKSTVANQIRTLRRSALIVDPEQVGFMLRRILPEEAADDFKDLPIWRELTASLLSFAAGAQQRLIVVPMTVTNPAHLGEIVQVLSEKGVKVRHFTLTASPDTLRRRVRWRLDWPSSRRWAVSRVDESVSALAHERFAMHVCTEEASPKAVAASILMKAGA